MTDKQADNPIEQLNKKGDTRGMHPNSTKNLKPNKDWVKGKSGNPNGRSITARQKELMDEPCPFDARGRAWLEALAEAGIRMALNQSTAMSNLQDRHEGKVTQPIATEGEIILKVKYDN